MDDSVIDALERALRSAPGDLALRLHLTSLLLDAGRALRALELCQEALHGDPSNADLLTLGALAADACGRSDVGEVLRARRDGGRAESPLFGDEPARVPVQEVVADAETTAEFDRPTTRLADVAGMTDVKRRLNAEFLAPLRDPALREAYGLEVRGGLLMWGPPGCGKTFVAHTLAGELGAGFLSIGIADVLDMYLGNSERNLAGLFSEARRHAPTLVFIDELDALGQRRSRMGTASMRTIVNLLLTELDGVDTNNEGIYVVGATNQPWDIDPALRRPGRFDRTICVLPPDAEARDAILRAALANRPLANDIDIPWLVSVTDTWSGADLAHLVKVAVADALAEALDTGTVVPVTAARLRAAHAELSPSTTDWLATAKAAATYSPDQAMFEPLVRYLRQRQQM